MRGRSTGAHRTSQHRAWWLLTQHGTGSPQVGSLDHMTNEARRESGQHRGLQARQIGLQTQTLPSKSCVSLSKVSVSSSLGFLTC